jgi:hypothetical protein
MAKLYWRVKVNGKWTWTAASIVHEEWTADELTVYLDNVPGRDSLYWKLEEEE